MLVSLNKSSQSSKVKFASSANLSSELIGLSKYEQALLLRKDYFVEKRTINGMFRAAYAQRRLLESGVPPEHITALSLSERILLSLAKKRVAASKAAKTTPSETI